MDKKSIWVIVAIVILALLAYLFLFNKKSAAPGETSVEGTSQSATQSSTAENSSAGPQSLKDLVAGGKSLKCTFKDGSSEGTTYISGGKARGDFSTGTQKGHMIMADSTSYIWMDGSSQGFKSALNSQASAPTTPTGGTPSQGVDSSKKMDYSCSAWSADSSMFTLPTSVQFMDLAGMMKANQ